MNDAVGTEPRPIANGCATDRVLKFLSREWLAHVIRALGAAGVPHFGALRRALPERISGRAAPRNGPAALVEDRLTPDGAMLDGMLHRFQLMLEGTPLPRRLRGPEGDGADTGG